MASNVTGSPALPLYSPTTIAGAVLPAATYNARLCTVPPVEEVYSKASADPPADVSVLDWTAELPTSNPDDSAALTTALAAELADVDPPALLAVTTTRIVWPTSPAVSL